MPAARAPRKPPTQDTAALSQKLRIWMPTLLRAWRKQFGFPGGPGDRLLPRELALVTSGLTRMSQGLTRERKLAGKDYFSDPGQLGAYLLFYWPVSYAQAREVLKQLHPVPRTILDLGSGAGPLGAAGMDSGARHVTFADRSTLNLKLAQSLTRPRERSGLTQVWDGQAPNRTLSGRFDLIGLQHVLNELWAETTPALSRREVLLDELKANINPAGRLLLLEPALTSTSRELIRLRDRLLTRGWQLHLPCLWRETCPALDKISDSCHFEWDWDPPPLVRTLIRQAGMKKKQIKMTYFVFSPPGSRVQPLSTQETFLIVSEPLRSKNQRTRLIGCGPAGRVPLALHPRDHSASNRAFLNLRRGDTVQLLGAEPTEQGFRLTPITRVQLIRSA